MHRQFLRVPRAVSIALLFLGATSALAITTVDVHAAAAIDGVWRPTSCDEVKGGVVLTNISDGVRAVIEGCTITVEADSDDIKAAVSIAGLGKDSTVELIGCNITATGRSLRGAVYVHEQATLWGGSQLLLHGTSVSADPGDWGTAVAVRLDGVSAEPDFQFRVLRSVLTARGKGDSRGVDVSGRFHGHTPFVFDESTVSAHVHATAQTVKDTL